MDAAEIRVEEILGAAFLEVRGRRLDPSEMCDCGHVERLHVRGGDEGDSACEACDCEAFRAEV